MLHVPATRYASPDIRPLTARDIPQLRLPWDGRFSPAELERIILDEPHLAMWNERSGEFVIGGRWRHRDEIATLVELAASGGAIDLMHGLAARATELGFRLLVASEQSERRREEFYAAAGFGEVEDIVIYELVRVRARHPLSGALRFEPFRRGDATQFEELLDLDHRAFPWMWWNCRAEIINYIDTDGVAIDIGRDASGRAVAYVGTTRFRTWGHLDRIAVDPALQGRGLGRAALDYAVMSLASSGAKRVGLSTQAANTRSRRLYEAYGFRRAPSHDYRIYGRRLGPAGQQGEGH
jgi:ribosomal protein S18 acetylase RimI-like enzyme